MLSAIHRDILDGCDDIICVLLHRLASFLSININGAMMHATVDSTTSDLAKSVNVCKDRLIHPTPHTPVHGPAWPVNFPRR
jgi:hypothetical protein